MNLEDLVRKTISEVSSQIEELQKQKELLKDQKNAKVEFEVIESSKEELSIEEEPEISAKTKQKSSTQEVEIENLKQDKKESKKEQISSLSQKEPKQDEQLKAELLQANLQSQQELSSEVLNASVIMQSLGEDIFLKNLRERILVLFEGLNRIEKEDLEQRLNLTINFLEFLLANIEDKLKKQ